MSDYANGNESKGTAHSNTTIDAKMQTLRNFQGAEKATACIQAGIEIGEEPFKSGEQNEKEHNNLTVEKRRVTSTDWIPEYAGSAICDGPLGDVFKHSQGRGDEPISNKCDCVIPDDMVPFFIFVRHHKRLQPVEASEDFLNSKRSGGNNNVPSYEWTREIDRQKKFVMCEVQRISESSSQQSVAKTSSFTLDESSMQSSLSSVVTTKETANEKVSCIPTDEDVLLGRGGLTNHHPGNKRYRKEASKLKAKYMKCTKKQKTGVSEQLVKRVKSWGGRFLIREKNGVYYEASKDKARKKASQALREYRSLKSISDDISI